MLKIADVSLCFCKFIPFPNAKNPSFTQLFIKKLPAKDQNAGSRTKRRCAECTSTRFCVKSSINDRRPHFEKFFCIRRLPGTNYQFPR